jgi:hypothetical protein
MTDVSGSLPRVTERAKNGSEESESETVSMGARMLRMI